MTHRAEPPRVLAPLQVDATVCQLSSLDLDGSAVGPERERQTYRTVTPPKPSQEHWPCVCSGSRIMREGGKSVATGR